MSLIVLDIETSGLLPDTHSLLSIGAVALDTGETFYAECKLGYGKTADEAALRVNGFTHAQIADPAKSTPEEIYRSFAEWARQVGGDKVLLGGQQVGSFDIPFLHEVAGGKAAFEQTFSKRSVDLHSLCYGVTTISCSLDEILCGLGLDPEPKPHNALTGARLEAEAFRRLLSRISHKTCGCS